jgi:cysteine sulfinate desulfinase/cysteine desulfurase-like protein
MLDAGGHGFSSDPSMQPVSEHLKAHNVMHTIRRGQLRFGLHGYNNDRDIDYALDVAREGFALARRAVAA